MCKLSLTEIKHIFEEDATMLQISEIVKKTGEMFGLIPILHSDTQKAAFSHTSLFRGDQNNPEEF